MFSSAFVCLSVSYIMQKLMDGFSRNFQDKKKDFFKFQNKL